MQAMRRPMTAFVGLRSVTIAGSRRRWPCSSMERSPARAARLLTAPSGEAGMTLVHLLVPATATDPQKIAASRALEALRDRPKPHAPEMPHDQQRHDRPMVPVGLLSRLRSEGRETLLMGETIRVARGADGTAAVATAEGRSLPVTERYGHVWSSLGQPAKPLFDIPEAEQPGRRMVDVGVVRVRCSPLRAVENFLDIAHFPFVHTDILGAEPHTEVEKLQGGDPRGRRRGLGDAGEVLSAASRQIGKRRHHHGIYVPGTGTRPAPFSTRPARPAPASGT